MFLRIEKGSSAPVSRQIADQIRALCLAGTLKPNEQLPSVRQLARELAVNQNTILRVYERLTAEGMLERRQGDGTYVAPHPPTWRMDGQRQRFAEEWNQLVRQGLMLGLSGDDLQALLDESLADAKAAESFTADSAAAISGNGPPR
jgi:GntR family transcriptional regulator